MRPQPRISTPQPSWQIPDADSLLRLLPSIVVFWGLAAACLRSEHIKRDLVVDDTATDVLIIGGGIVGLRSTT